MPSTVQLISYTAFNKATRLKEMVVADSLRLDIMYGPDEQRWKSVLKKNGTDQKTIIFAGDYEKVTENGVTKELYYIGAPDGLAAVYVKDAIKGSGMLYAHTDHQGSIVSLTDSIGGKVFQASYDAWGKQTVSLNTIGFYRGFTGHEHLPEFGLINMNGRMYDPVLGRFLSPDNYVQEGDLSQNFNRYSYCLNNPLKYTDPEGEWFGWDDLGEFVVGGAINVIFNWDKIDNFWEGLSYFGSGGAGAWITFQSFGLAAPVGGAITTAGNNLLDTNFLTKEEGYSFKSITNDEWKKIGWKSVIGAGTAWAGDWLGGKLADKVEDKLHIKSAFWIKSTDKMIKNGISNGLDNYLNSTIIDKNAWDSEEAFKSLGMGIGTGVAKGMASTYLDEKWARPELQKIKELGFVLNIRRESWTKSIFKYLYNPLLPPSYRIPSTPNFNIPNSNN